MTKHELMYFDAPGRAEPIRILLHAAGIKFHDQRIQGKDWGAELKKTTPIGSMPVLTIDGVPHVQSISLARYAARKAGFYPESDPLQMLVVDEVLDCLNEILSNAPSDSDEDEKKRKRLEWQQTGLTQYANFVESRIQTFGNGKSVAATPSVADLWLKGVVSAVETGTFDYIDVDFFDVYPGIK